MNQDFGITIDQNVGQEKRTHMRELIPVVLSDAHPVITPNQERIIIAQKALQCPSVVPARTLMLSLLFLFSDMVP